MYISKTFKNNQSGFTLIEIMVGLVIGLVATLVIMQVITAFEGQKRTTTGNADAQVNGSIALYNIQRQIQMAGYGLPIFDASTTANNSPLKCTSSLIDHDGDSGTAIPTAKIDFFPIAITDGGASGNDTITIRYFPSANGGLPATVTSNITGLIIGVDNNLGCTNGDTALVVNGTTCNAAKVNDITLTADTTHITVTGIDVIGMAAGSRISCLGSATAGAATSRQEIIYRINAGQLESSNSTPASFTPVISDIVGLQAQYGISATSTSNQVTQWVDATVATGFATPTIANRNRIRAIRIAIFARNGLLEKTAVTTACTSTTAAATGLCAWDGTVASPAPAVGTTGLTAMGGTNYRYRVYNTVIPLRNMTWSGAWL